jgi:hypothetical protein
VSSLAVLAKLCVCFLMIFDCHGWFLNKRKFIALLVWWRSMSRLLLQLSMFISLNQRQKVNKLLAHWLSSQAF